MGTLGTLLNIAIALYVVYFGYMAEFNPAYLLVATVGFMAGHVLRKSQKSSSIWETRHRNILVALIFNILSSALMVAIWYGVGYGIHFFLEFRPEEGIGRY